MKRVKAYLSIGFVQGKHEEIFEFDDEATEQEMEEIIHAWAMDRVDWGFYEVE